MRPGGPELILDGDMVLAAPPPWLDEWLAGRGPPRVSQDDRTEQPGALHRDKNFGAYSAAAASPLMLYSAAAALPPGLRLMPLFRQVRVWRAGGDSKGQAGLDSIRRRLAGQARRREPSPAPPNLCLFF
jgi:hypothetical protein